MGIEVGQDFLTVDEEELDPSSWNWTVWNGTQNETVTEEGGNGTANAIGLALLLASFSAATVFGNSLVILAVARERYLHSVTNYFITSLAVADCLVGLVVMPFQAIFETMGKTWIFGEFWCDLWHSLDVLASTASILHLSVISLDRYWAITDPFSYPSRMTTTRACVLIALIWVCSSLISFPAILWWRAVRSHPIKDLTCPFTNDLGYLVFSSIISFYGPLVLMAFTYLRIYKAAVEQTRSLKLGSKLCTDGDVELTLRIHRGGGAAMSYPTPPPSDLPRSQSNPGRILPGGRQNSAEESEIELVTDIVTWLGWINSGMNPVIYACWSRDFRRAFGRLLCVCCPNRIRKQYRPGGLRPRLARLTQLSLRTAAMPFDDTMAADLQLTC